MQIDATTHEHGKSAKVYNYEGDFDIGDDAITWKAAVWRGVRHLHRQYSSNVTGRYRVGGTGGTG